MYAITNKVGDPSQMAIVGTAGRLDFPASDGPTLASLLDSEFPACVTGCGTREGVCGDCGYCPDCGACGSCAEFEDYEEDEA